MMIDADALIELTLMANRVTGKAVAEITRRSLPSGTDRWEAYIQWN